MIVARYNHGQLIVLDRLREMVRLAAGLDEHGRLSRESTQRALQCLERFGQRLRDMRAESVRVVGTNTLRKAKRRGVFLERARDALGHPIEIISGVEEARLIYLGVAHTTPNEGGHRLVVDIGGGSTELIIGEGLAAEAAREPVHGLRQPERALLCRWRDHRKAHEARAHGGAPRTRAGHQSLQAIRVGHRVWRLGHVARRGRHAAGTRAGRNACRPRGSRVAAAGSAARRPDLASQVARTVAREAGGAAGRPRHPARGVRQARHRDDADCGRRAA